MVYAALKDTPLHVLGIVDSGPPAKRRKRFNGFTVQSPRHFTEMPADAVLVTSFARQEEIHTCIRQVLGNEGGVR